MPVAAEGRRYRSSLEKDVVLLVEGRDEMNLFEAFKRGCLDDDGESIQVLPVGGKDQFKKQFAVIKSDAPTRPSLRSIGVIRDADENAQSSFQSVCNGIRSVGYEPPVAHGEFSNAVPSIGVFIVPDGSGRGAIETLCRQSVQDTDAAICVDDYLTCLSDRHALQSRNSDKTFTHAYLAAMQNPTARVGEGALQGVWNFRSPVFESLRQFIQTLVSKGQR